jgi:dTDP-4-dehydrorhamnose 3,5-epimerase
MSKTGVLRGVHRTPYAKLVTCIRGKIYDVCVDLRLDSPTYNMTFGIELNSNNLFSLYIPPYCGHGFLALEESVVLYHQDGEYDRTLDETYCYKHFDIKWPKEPLLVSNKDSDICSKPKYT